jgi:uncharacterized protein YjbI with pentapeptide repeats
MLPLPPTHVSATPLLRTAKREERLDVEIESDVTDSVFVREYWKRVSARGRTFKNTSFKFTVFESCYFHNCTFDHCNFVGTSFTDGNLRGSTFEGCSFKYARFTRSIVPYDVLERNLPSEETCQARRTCRCTLPSIYAPTMRRSATRLE